MKNITLHVQGTHCNACKILIEETLTGEQGINKVHVDLHKKTVELQGDMELSEEELVKTLNPLLKEHKYTLSIDKVTHKKEEKDLGTAIPLGLGVLFIFFLLQKSGIINMGFEGGFTPLTALFIGFIASLSTCLAVVGGLILSLSAKVTQGTSSFKPFTLFHAGRIIGFALLGGALGALGNAISINGTITSVLGLLASGVMIILGINLMDIFHGTKKLQIALPKHFYQKLVKIEKGFWTPLILGCATFFLPCGFTQSVQIAALASGSWLQGGLTMFMFSLGTLPMLVLISFSSYKFAHSKYARLFYQTSGIVVIGLGIFALLAGLAGLGIIKPLFNV